MKTNTTIGFEFQTPDLSFTQVKQNTLVHPDSFFLNTINNELKVYGDQPTSKRPQYNSVKRDMTDNHISSFSFKLDSGSKTYTVTAETCQHIFNDAEFVFTDTKVISVECRHVFQYMYERMCQAFPKIDRYISSLPKRHIVSPKEIIQQKRPRHTVKFPYHFFYHDSTFAFLGHDETPHSFHVQCTLGVEIMHVRQILCDFVRIYLPYARQSETRYLEKVLEINAECPPSLTEFEQDMYFLFVYCCETFGHRKKAPFLVRHLFSNIWKQVSKKTLDKLITCFPRELRVHDMTIAEFAMALSTREYIPVSQTMSQERLKKRIELKVFQDLDVSTTFPISTPLTRKTLVLIEFRYFHRFIMTVFFHQKKSKTTLLTINMCK